MPHCEACKSQRITTLLDNLSYCYEQNDTPATWRYRLLECRECGLAFVDPKPTWETLERFYDKTYGPYKPSNVESELKSGKYWVTKQRYSFVGSKGFKTITRTAIGIAAEWITGKTVSFTLGIPLQFPKDARIFELGYGDGDWLRIMSSLGYNNLSGYDIDSNSENKATLSVAGINISDGIFLKNDYPDSALDCIRLEHVFEHLLCPVEVLTKCHAMLKPGGMLVMNFPCISSWSRDLSLIHYANLDLPRHLYHHTQRSAALMVKAAGFKVLKVKAFSAMSVFVSTLNNLLLDKNKKQIPLFLFSPFAPLYRLFGTLTHKGDLITIWARKNQKRKP